jgi:hypothetical protein
VKKRVVVLYWHPPGPPMRAGVLAHLRSLESMGGVEVLFVNAYSPPRRLVSRLHPDAMVLHNTFLCMRWSHLFPSWKWELRWIADADCPKIALPQDEYDHAHVLDEWLYELGVTTVVSNFDAGLGEILYPICSGTARFHKRFTGYVDEVAARKLADRIVPLEDRQVDIVYRATRLPYWFGSHGQLKHRIGSTVAEAATVRGLPTDISTRGEDTIVGDAWLDFLMSGRAVIGCESGSSVLDRRGEVRAAIQDILRDDPALTFEEVAERMPEGWDDYAFFALSPRHFEAVVTKTPQVLVEGSYDGVLQPDRHYLPLARDLSNLDDVLEAVNDSGRLAELAECAYEEIYLSGRYTYRSLSELVRQIVDETPRHRGRSFAPSWALMRASERGTRAVGAVAAKAHLPQPRIRRPSRGEIARALAALVSIQRRPALRALVAESARCDPRPSPRRLAADVLRLHLIAAAEAGTGVGPPFSVAPVVDGSTLILRSRPHRAEDTRDSVDAALAAVTAGEIEHFEWDHRSIGTCAPYPVPSGRWLSIRIGDTGVYSFTSLGAVVKRDRRTAADLLRRVLSGEPGARVGHRYDVGAPADASARRSTASTEQQAARDHTRQSEA